MVIRMVVMMKIVVDGDCGGAGGGIMEMVVMVMVIMIVLAGSCGCVERRFFAIGGVGAGGDGGGDGSGETDN